MKQNKQSSCGSFCFKYWLENGCNDNCNTLKSNIMSKYIITGILKNGKRFKPIHTDTPQHFNIWKGTIWKITNSFNMVNEQRKLIIRINW
jgi:hypothetical protein